jgi:hypothetical protein
MQSRRGPPYQQQQRIDSIRLNGIVPMPCTLANLEWRTVTAIPNVHCWLHMILHVK